ncbi:hypothetical protein FRC08_016121, partial [Ceratobasidium sp. 394]
RHNVISIAVVEWYLTVMMCGLVNNDPRLFLAYSQEANAVGLRLAAMDALLLTKWWRTRTLIQYIFAVIAHDPSREVRRHVARAVIAGLAVLHAIGDVRPAGKDEPLLLIEDDGSTPARDKAKKGEGDMLVKVLKKEIGRSKQLRDSIMPIMLAPDVDHEVRWCMLKLADLIYRPAEEPPVKLKIVLPSTPVSEFPPQPPTPAVPSAPPPKKPLPALRQTPSLKINLPSSIPKLKFVGSASPRASAGPLPPLVPPITPSPLAFESTPGKNGIPLPDVPAMPAEPTMPTAPTAPTAPTVPTVPAPMPLPEPEPESATIPLPRPKKVKQVAPLGGHQGMDKTTHAHCKAVLNALNRNPHANVFRLPVDPVRDLAPNYFDVIKHPMDLSTMKAKLDNKAYRNRAAFEDDFKLMVQNAKTYNAPKSLTPQRAPPMPLKWNRPHLCHQQARSRSRRPHLLPLALQLPRIASCRS